MKLAERVEQADESQQREMLELAWAEITGLDFNATHSIEDERRIMRFLNCLEAEAYLDAAVMLVPEGSDWFKIRAGNAAALIFVEDGDPTRPNPLSKAATPALALVAASLRAKEEGK